MSKVLEVQVAEPMEVVNDSSSGLARMQADLAPLAARLRSSACVLLMFSFFFLGSIEGIFGALAAMGILCCAAPSSLGVAHAARCARINATIAALFALLHLTVSCTFAVAVLPSMPAEAMRYCKAEAKAMNAVDAPADAPPARFHLLADWGLSDGLEVLPMAADDSRADIVASTTAVVANKVGRKLEQAYIEVHAFAIQGPMQVVDLADGNPAHPPALSPGVEARCGRLSRFFEKVAPALIFAVAIMQFGIFVSALSTARHAAVLTNTARRMGANGM